MLLTPLLLLLLLCQQFLVLCWIFVVVAALETQAGLHLLMRQVGICITIVKCLVWLLFAALFMFFQCYFFHVG